MKLLLHSLVWFAVLMLSWVQAAPASVDQPTGFRLTIELRDGSRVIGISRDNTFRFHSEVLGDLKLALQKIRRIESLTKTNLAKLTTATDDSLTVEFAMKEIRLETTYGKIELPVAMVKSVQVTALGAKAGRPRDGLIGLWSAEGNAFDFVRENNGVMQYVSFTMGVVGQAFTFSPDSFTYGTYVGIQIPDQPAYALTQALTIEGWVRPRGNGYVILCRGDHRPGLDPYTLSMQANHTLRFQICGEAGDSAFVDALIPYCEWTHVAAVLDENAGTMTLYTNGIQAAQTKTNVRPIGQLLPGMSPGLGIGNLNDGGNNFPFIGDLDEIALYNRALSVEEVNAIYTENSANAGGRIELLPSRNVIRNSLPIQNAFPSSRQQF
jgi:hypothetical protein